MASVRVLFAVLAVLGTAQAAPRRHHSHAVNDGVSGVSEGQSTGTEALTSTASRTGGATAPTPVTPPVNGTLSAVVVPSSDCKCGYVLSAYSDAYFPFHHSTGFTAGPEGPISSVTGLSAYKLTASAQGESMGAAGKAVAVQDLKNIQINNGILELVVPGGQTGGEITSAQLIFEKPVTGGVFTMEAKIDATPGTCQSIFTYHKWIQGDDSKHDEQDIELLGTSLLQDTSSAPKGIQLTSYNPAVADSNDNTIIPYPDGVDPVNDFHKYTIAWVPSGTKYAFDGTVLKGPTKYSSVNPSNVILNHWSSASSFTSGPPTKDVVMGVKSIDFYYATEAQTGLLNGCTMEQACRG